MLLLLPYVLHNFGHHRLRDAESRISILSPKAAQSRELFPSPARTVRLDVSEHIGNRARGRQDRGQMDVILRPVAAKQRPAEAMNDSANVVDQPWHDVVVKKAGPLLRREDNVVLQASVGHSALSVCRPFGALVVLCSRSGGSRPRLKTSGPSGLRTDHSLVIWGTPTGGNLTTAGHGVKPGNQFGTWAGASCRRQKACAPLFSATVATLLPLSRPLQSV